MPDATTAPPPSALTNALREREDALHNCVHCGFCLPACPTYARLGDEADSPRGRLHLMKAVVEGRLGPDTDAFRTHIDRCLGCRACEPVCPSGVEYGLLLERARSVIREAAPPRGMKRYLPDIMASLPRRPLLRFLLRAFRGSRIPALLPVILPRWQWLRPVRFGSAMIASTAPAPLPRAGASAPSPAPTWPRTRVGILTGCIQDTLYRRVNDATALTLEVNGYEVVPVPAQGCCGALHAHDGDLEGARRLARANVRAFEEAGVDFIATNAAGCGAVMKEYGELLGGGGSSHLRGEGRSDLDAESSSSSTREDTSGEEDAALSAAAHRIAAKCRDVTELLAERGPLPGAPLPIRVAYDAPCHLLHAQGVSSAPLDVLAAIPGLEVRVVRNADECCGGAGTYGITHPELGSRIGRDKLEAVMAEAPDACVTGNPGCLMQIGAEARSAGRPLPGRHPVELLAESYRGRQSAGAIRASSTVGAVLLFAALAGCSGGASSAPGPQVSGGAIGTEGAHEHGVVQMGLAVDGNRVSLDLEVSSDAVFGFEHAPSSDEERAIVSQALDALRSGAGSLIGFSPELGCIAGEVEILEAPEVNAPEEGDASTQEQEHEEAHSEVRFTLEWSCAASPEGSAATLAVQQVLPEVEHVDLTVITSAGQAAGRVAPDAAFRF